MNKILRFFKNFGIIAVLLIGPSSPITNPLAIVLLPIIISRFTENVALISSLTAALFVPTTMTMWMILTILCYVPFSIYNRKRVEKLLLRLQNKEEVELKKIPILRDRYNLLKIKTNELGKPEIQKLEEKFDAIYFYYSKDLTIAQLKEGLIYNNVTYKFNKKKPKIEIAPIYYSTPWLKLLKENKAIMYMDKQLYIWR